MPAPGESELCQTLVELRPHSIADRDRDVLTVPSSIPVEISEEIYITENSFQKKKVKVGVYSNLICVFIAG